MTVAISSSHTSSEIWAIKDKRGTELTIISDQLSEPAIQKIQKIAPQRLSMVNTHITKALVASLVELRLEELTFTDCTLKDADAEFLAFSGAKERVLFKRCLLTDLTEGDSTHTEIISLGIWKRGEEIAVVNPDLMDLAEKTSIISEECTENIDFMDRNLQIEEVAYEGLLAEQMKLSIQLYQATRAFIEKHIATFALLWVQSSVDSPQEVIREIEKKADGIKNILEQINASGYEKVKQSQVLSQEKLKESLYLLTKAHAELEEVIGQNKQRCGDLFSADSAPLRIL